MKTVTSNRQLMKALRKINRGFDCSCEVLLFMNNGKVVIDKARAVYPVVDDFKDVPDEAEDVPAEDAKIIHEDKPEWRRGFR